MIDMRRFSRGCRRHTCPDCDELMIHRDHRRGNESSSAFGQIVHDQGPTQMTAGDIDLYAAKWKNRQLLLRLLEHKLPEQKVGTMQANTLEVLDCMFAYAIKNKVDLKGSTLLPGSGVYTIRGLVDTSPAPDFSTSFQGDQVAHRWRDGEKKTFSDTELFDWMNDGPGWTPRNGRGRFGGNKGGD